MSKVKKIKEIAYKLYKNGESLKEFKISVETPKRYIHSYILDKEPDLLIINDFLPIAIGKNFKLDMYFPKKRIRKRKKKKNPQPSSKVKNKYLKTLLL